MKVITCLECAWHTSVAYLEKWGRCWHCGGKMAIPEETEDKGNEE